MDILADLNPSQREAVQAIEGPLLILAGPGSGKTRVITHRIAYLIREVQVSPYHIVAVTFTNKAAREMRERLERLLGGRTQGLTVGTFHATCARFLRRDIEHLGRDRSFVIYDADDQEALIKQVLKDLQLNDKQYRPGALLGRISRAKSEMVGPAEFVKHTESYWEEVCSRVYERYQKLLLDRNALDFDDLLLTPVQLYQQHPDVLARTQDRIVHLLVDEFQDTNLVQYELVKLWGDQLRNIFVVGDEDQGIYSWRNADIANIQRRFRQDYPERREIILTRNYRSTRTILDAAQSVIARNPDRTDKQLVTEKVAGPAITLYEAYDESEESDYVALEIARLYREGALNWGDMAVMYRTNAQSRAIEDALVRRGIPYKLVGGTRFYQRREVKDVLAYLRLAHNPADAGALERVINVPRRGIGQRTQDELVRWARRLDVSTYEALKKLRAAPGEDVPISGRAARPLLDFARLVDELVEAAGRLTVPELLDLVLERTAYSEYIRDGTEEGEGRWENVQELRTVTAEYVTRSPDEGLSAFLEEVALVSDVDSLEEQPQAVTLLTLHTAKGLEFPAVFIVGMEEGLLPHSRSIEAPAQLAEERRLCYVGMTRAKDHLYLLHAFRRTLYGNSRVNDASRFLKDVPTQLIAGRQVRGERPLSRPASSESRGAWRAPATTPVRATPAWQEPAAPAPATPRGITFKAGDKVRHSKFGEGTVINSEVTRDDEQVTVAFVGAGVKKLLVSYAPLEKIPA
ncbi:MAG: UvrD-helicase domain-containing protein [Chloroflexi bacterium]|nr:UvrD-helicase domain-containing protein [Chloroflexota bacterium]MBU1746218.1 UvrD-helicase domain-containing protein [Chloroflexota bacterium]